MSNLPARCNRCTRCGHRTVASGGLCTRCRRDTASTGRTLCTRPARRPPGDATIVPLTPLPRVGPQDIYSALLADARCPNTEAGRRWDIITLTYFMGETDPSEACAAFIEGGHANAEAIAMAWRRAGQDEGLANGTINRRLATIRRLVRLARRFDLVAWALDVELLPNVTYRDTRGPGDDGWRKLWAAAEAAGDSPQAKRNRALVRLLRDNALRKAEACALDLEDVDLAGERIAIKPKGRAGCTLLITINRKVVDLLRTWIAARGPDPGPLFVSHIRIDHQRAAAFVARVAELQRSGLRMREVAEALNAQGWTTPTGLPWDRKAIYKQLGRLRSLEPYVCIPDRDCNRILATLSRAAGIGKVRPHGLRHLSISRILDLTNGDVRAAQRHARHANVAHTLRYDDNRTDLAGKMARLLGDDD